MRLLLLLLLSCSPPPVSVCVDVDCSAPPIARDTYQPEPLPPVDSGTLAGGSIVSAVQRWGYIDVSYTTEAPGVLHVGGWSAEVSGSGSITAPIQHVDLCILEQDIRISLEVDGIEVERFLLDTKAAVRRPGDWRWWTDGDGSVTVECRVIESLWLLVRTESEVVWDVQDSPTWQKVSWSDVGGTWTMGPDRVMAQHGTQGTLLVEPSQPLVVAVLGWDE